MVLCVYCDPNLSELGSERRCRRRHPRGNVYAQFRRVIDLLDQLLHLHPPHCLRHPSNVLHELSSRKRNFNQNSNLTERSATRDCSRRQCVTTQQRDTDFGSHTSHNEATKLQRVRRHRGPPRTTATACWRSSEQRSIRALLRRKSLPEFSGVFSIDSR